MTPGTTVRLPNDPPVRKGAKPKQRTGIVRASTDWEFPGHVLVEKCDRGGVWWVRVDILEVVEDGK